MSAIDVQGLGVEVGNQWILRGINLTVERGSFCAITGPSGSGKSTFLRLLLGQLRPAEGRVLLEGVPMPDHPTPDRGVVFQNYSVFAHRTALDNILLGLKFKHAPHTGWVFGDALRGLRDRSMQALADVGLEKAAQKYPHELSGGMCQRLAIAQAMIARPKLLLLDEPFGALDPTNRTQLQLLVRDLWRNTGATIVMVTHDEAEAQTLATKLLRFEPCRESGHTRIRIQTPPTVSIGTPAVRALDRGTIAPKRRKQKRKARNRR